MPRSKSTVLIPAATLALLAPAVVPAGASAFSWSDLLSGLTHTTQSATQTTTDTVNAVTDPITSDSSSDDDGCVQTDVRKAFESWGDDADYSLAPGGDLESTAGWSFKGGAKIVRGNEDLGIQGGTHSLTLPLGSSATSPAFCVDESTPYFRFAAKPTSAVAGYTAVVIYRDAAGTPTKAQFTASSFQSWSPGKWAPSAISPLGVKIPLLNGGKTASVQIQFNSTGNATAAGVAYWGKFAAGAVGTVGIDSLMVDPYRRG
jgi:hypothetical protein